MAKRTYVAFWSDNEERALAGTLSLGEEALRFEGSAPGRLARRRIAYGLVQAMHLGRTNGERIGGRPALVLQLGDGRPNVRIATPEPGALYELTETLAELTEVRGVPAMRNIVIATDGSFGALRAVEEGLELADDLAADVTFVTVRTPPNAMWGAPVYQAELETSTQVARKAIDDALALADGAGIDADYEILDGPAGESIAAIAESRDADFIVVGSRGRGAVKGALFGSVSKAVVTHAHRPVLVVKEPTHEPAHA
jgi:nucleotide-binding universal stress UspA family protein